MFPRAGGSTEARAPGDGNWLGGGASQSKSAAMCNARRSTDGSALVQRQEVMGPYGLEYHLSC